MFGRIKSPRSLVIGIAAAAGLFAAAQANAHTISVGTFNAGSPGSVTVVPGSYHTSGSPEGAIQLISGPVTTGVVNFSNLTLTKPGELIDGDNNFFGSASCCGDPAGTFNETSNLTGLAVVRWQSVTFTGLSAGDYTYQISGMNTDVWEDWGSLTNNWQGSLTITQEVVVGELPEPGTLAVLGLSIFGLGIARRRRKA
jgi:hypothetical protein